MRVAICTPSRDEVKAGYCFALASLILANTYSMTLTVLNERGPDVSRLRNRLVERALKLDVDALLWVDADIIFPLSGLSRLLAHDAPIVGATYALRSQLHAENKTPMLAHEEFDSIPVNVSTDVKGARRIKSLPGGALLVKSEVYSNNVFSPWYERVSDDTPEDWHFCAKARKAGIDILLDSVLSSQVLHLGEFAYGVNPC